MSTFKHGDLEVAAGTRGHGVLGELSQASGTATRAPYQVVNGAQEGPTFVVIAGSHGNELVGIGIPAVNVPALSAGAYVSPVDGEFVFDQR